MDDGEISGGSRRNRNLGNAIGWRQRGEKGEGQVAHHRAEFGALVAVPGVDRIETLNRRRGSTVDNAHKIESRVGDGARTIGETNQWERGSRRPDFGVLGAGRLKRREREDYVADGAGANQQPPHYFRPYSLRALSRSTMRASPAARSRVISPSESMPVSAIPSAVRPACAEM
jgi:hypothetical protein